LVVRFFMEKVLEKRDLCTFSQENGGQR